MRNPWKGWKTRYQSNSWTATRPQVNDPNTPGKAPGVHVFNVNSHGDKLCSQCGCIRISQQHY